MDKSSIRAPAGGTDLGQIWITAVRNYEQKTGKKLGVENAENAEEVKAGLDKVLDKFKRHRQDPAKKDAFATKLKNCCGQSISTIHKILQGIEVLGDAASAFPPAMPAGLIFSALDHVLDTFQRVTADYDKLEAFFTNSQRFLDQLSILEDKPQPSPFPLQKCVERIFSAHLDMCAVAQKFQKDGKFETWAKDLWRGRDPDIKMAYSSMDDALAEFSRTLNISTYSKVLDTYEELHVFRLEVTAHIEEVDHKLDIAAESHLTMTTEVREFHNEMSQKEDHVLAGVQDMRSKVDKLATLFFYEKARSSEESKPQKEDKGPKPSNFVDKRAAAVSQIEGHFERNGFVDWEETRDENDSLQSDMQDAWMDGTSAWFLNDEPAFQNWINDDPSVLFITGGNGAGKSFLCYAALQKVLRQTDGVRHSKNVASYFFQSDLESQISGANGLGCAAWQASSLDSKYSEEVAAAIRRDSQDPEFKTFDFIADTWNRFFVVPYSAPGRSLYLFLDALDEASDDDRPKLIQQLALIKEKNLNIRLFITGRNELRKELDILNPTTVELTPKRLSDDISTVIKTHLKALPRLQSLSRKLKAQILQKVRDKSDGILYAHHALQRLNQLGRPARIRKALKTLPESLDELYGLIVAECYKNRSDEQQQALKTMFSWLAYAMETLTISDLRFLMKSAEENGVIDVAEEISTRLSTLLRITHVENETSLGDESEDSEAPEPADPAVTDTPPSMADNTTVEATEGGEPVDGADSNKKVEATGDDKQVEDADDATPVAATAGDAKVEPVASEASESEGGSEDDESDKDGESGSDGQGADSKSSGDEKVERNQKPDGDQKIELEQKVEGDKTVKGDQTIASNNKSEGITEDGENELAGDKEHEDDGEKEGASEKKDEDENQDGEDGSDDDTDDEDGDSSRVFFQNRTLIEYFKAIPDHEDGLRTTAWEAQISILEKMVQILCDTARDRDQDNKNPPLAEYTSNYWHRHLMEIDINDASDEGVKRVLLGLHDITTDKDDLSIVLETYAEAKDLYPWIWPATPGGAAPAEETWVDFMGVWAQRGKELESVTFEPEMEEWVSGVAEDAYKALEDLARQHARNWFAAEQLWDIKEAFKFARAALRFSTPFTEQNLREEVRKVADAYPHVKKEYVPERSIAGIYIECGLVEEGIALLIQWIKDARGHPKHGLSQFFFANFILAEAYITLEKFQEAESAFEAAVELRPQLEEKAFIKEQYRELLISRATNLTVLGKLTEAVAAYDEARAADDDALDSVYLDEMLLVYNDSNDPDGLKGLDIIKSWTNEERLALFDYYMELADSDSIIRIFKAGKTAGELDLLLGWIEDFKRSSSVKPESAGMFFYQKTLADIHYRIMNDPAAAKEIYTTALNMDIKIFGSGLIPDRLGARVSLAGIVFDEFRQSTDPQRKVELYQTLKTHLLKADNDVQDTNAVVSLALMARTVGSPLEFQSFLERGFNHCYENLTDTTGWNDQPSFRLLARILACVPGLERDALIAYSCQFYEVDKNLKGWKEDDSESDDSEAYVDEYFLYSQPSVNSGLQTTAPKHASDATNGSGAAVSEKITTSVAVSSTQESVVSADTAKTLVILHKEVEVEVKTTITESGPAAKPYDLSPYAWVICNGRCEGTHNQKRYKNWDDPVYLCIICPNCDLCADCHSKRLEMSTGEGTYWRDYCGRDHCYLKGPMEGWCGVRDGVVHVGGDAFAFKAWIEGLRSVRWKLAWDEFWLGRGYIKDL